MHYTAIMVIPNRELKKDHIRFFEFKRRGTLPTKKGDFFHLKDNFNVYLENKWKDYFKHLPSVDGELVLNVSNELKFDTIELFRGSNKFYLKNGETSSFSKIKDIDWNKTDSYFSTLYQFRKGQFINKFGFPPAQQYHLIDYVLDYKNQLWDTKDLSQDLLMNFLENHFNGNDYFTFVSLTKKEDHAM